MGCYHTTDEVFLNINVCVLVCQHTRITPHTESNRICSFRCPKNGQSLYHSEVSGK